MATITSSGIGSGLDIASLVDQLVAAEAAPTIARLTRQESDTNAELSALGTLKSALASLDSYLDKLSADGAFRPWSAVSSQDTLFKASATESAAAGRYQIEVVRLAQHHKLGSATFANTQTFGGTAGDKIDISAGGESFSIDLSAAKTLAELRDAINTSADNPGVTASLVNVDDTHQVLMITAADTGEANAVTLTETLAASPSLGFATANLDADGVVLTDLADLDALVRIDGLEIRRAGNTLEDVIEGVTLNLLEAEEGTRGTLTIASDKKAVSDLINGFIGAYNGLVSALNGVAGYKGEGATQPALFGDGMTRSLWSRLRGEIGRSVSGVDGTFAALSELGVTTGTDGRLSVDQTKLDAALDASFEGVGDIFQAENGLVAGLEGIVKPYVESNGLIDSRTKGLEQRLDRIDDDSDRLERRLESVEARYLAQFTAMDILVGQLQTTSSFLSQQFAMMASMYTSA